MNTHKLRSLEQEKRLAKKHGGRIQPGSGSGKTNKGDVKCPDFLIEAKSTLKDSFTITKALIDKIELEAVHEQKESLIQIEMGTRRVYVMTEETFDAYFRSSK